MTSTWLLTWWHELWSLFKVVPSRFLYCKVMMRLFPYSIFWNWVSKSSPCSKQWVYSSTPPWPPFSEKAMAPPLQCSCLENPVDGGASWAAVHGVAECQTRLSNLTFSFHFHALEKEMATHSSVLAWRIPGTAEPGGLPSMGLHRVGHDWSDLAAAADLLFNRWS